MKKFKNSKKAINWVKDIVVDTKEKALETVSEQIYKDSKEYTYLDTKEMYNSGSLYSDFKQGIITERTPYVRRRYYEGGKPGKGNFNALPHWFEETFNKYKNDYNNQIKNIANQTKKG